MLRKVRAIISAKLQDIIGVPMTPFDLIKALRSRGLELSPSERVRSQMADMKPKNKAVERHLYRCMAIVATSLKFSFLSTRFNAQADADKCVFQYQMIQGDNQLVNGPISINLLMVVSVDMAIKEAFRIVMISSPVMICRLQGAPQLVLVAPDRAVLLPSQDFNVSLEQALSPNANCEVSIQSNAAFHT